jgi:hypothetical protein
MIVLLLVPSQECAASIRRTLADRYGSDEIRVEVSDSAALDVVSRARRQFGGMPLGFVAVDEVMALEALSSGADEVLVWPPRDDAAVQGFFGPRCAKARSGTAPPSRTTRS